MCSGTRSVGSRGGRPSCCGATFAALQFVASKPVASPWLGWAVGAYTGAMACSLITVLPGWFKETRPRSLLVGLWLYPPERAAAELANNRLIAFEENVGRQGRMVFLVRASVGLGLAGAIMSTLHLMEGNRTDVERPPAATAGCSGGAAGPGGCGTAP